MKRLIARLSIKEDKKDEATKLARDMVELVRKQEKGETLEYKFHWSKSEMFVYEVYKDAKAMAAHSERMKPYLGKMGEMMSKRPDFYMLDLIDGVGESHSSSSSNGNAAESKEIEVGQPVPNAPLYTLDGQGKFKKINSDEIFKGKRVVLFAVPGPFTPGCTQVHLPGYIEAINEFKAKKVDAVCCISTADPYVMDAWKKSEKVPDQIQMLGDGNGELTKKLGLYKSLDGFGMGFRSKRYALLIENGIVKEKLIDHDGKVNLSSAKSVLSKL